MNLLGKFVQIPVFFVFSKINLHFLLEDSCLASVKKDQTVYLFGWKFGIRPIFRLKKRPDYPASLVSGAP